MGHLRLFYDLLPSHEKRQLLTLLAMIGVLSVLELVGVASIMPFLSLMANPDAIESNEYLALAYSTLGFTSHQSFMLAVGALVITAVVLTNVMGLITTAYQLRFVYRLHHSLSMRLLKSHLSQPYAFFVKENSKEFTTNLLAELIAFAQGYIKPLLQLAAQAIPLVGLLALLAWVNPLILFVLVATIGGAYGLIYLIVRRRLSKIGGKRLKSNTHRFRTANEVLEGIKEIKVQSLERAFCARFERVSESFSKVFIHSNLINRTPKYLIEATAMTILIAVMLAMLNSGWDSSEIVAVVGLYAFAGYRMMPKVQQAYISATQIRFHVNILETLHDGLVVHLPKELPMKIRGDFAPMTIERALRVDNVTFRYAPELPPALADVSLSIAARTSVGIVGSTGSGKTTLVDVMLGLLGPTEGALIVDDKVITEDLRPRWRRSVGYVPQSIFLMDASVRENIAFGVPLGEIDEERVIEVSKIARLHDFVVDQLPEGYSTSVGDRGIRLSGGQRQRIGIARALYHRPQVLFFDEATSALDNDTERQVMAALEEIGERCTLVMIAHRLNTVQRCDNIFILERGKIVGAGTYDELLATNERFQVLAAAQEAELSMATSDPP